MSSRIIWDTDELPDRGVIGTKAYNLMVMKQAGLPIPKFFTLLSNGSRDATLEDAVMKAAKKIKGDIIERSCHPLESGKHPFSGEFLSTFCDNEPGDIQKVYSMIRESARSESVLSYVKERKIDGFDPEAMNVIFMQYFPHRFFAMFMTTSQGSPDEMIVNQLDGRTQKGKWELYDKKAGKLKTTMKWNDGSTDAMQQFGEMGVRAEQLFGHPVQLESAINSEKKIKVFQARDIELTDPKSLAKPSTYQTMITGLRAQGYVSFEGPVLVLDEVRKVYPKKRIFTKEETASALLEYKAEIAAFIEQHPKYAVVLKELSDLVRVDYRNVTGRVDHYAYLNSILKNAVVQLRNKAQSLVRHEDWDSVEGGGAVIFIFEEERAFADKFHHKSEFGDYDIPVNFFKESIYLPGTGLTPINISNRQQIQTGDTLNVLSNDDGVFIW